MTLTLKQGYSGRNRGVGFAIASVLVLALTVAATARAQTPADAVSTPQMPARDSKVAEVNGEAITFGEVMEAHESSPQLSQVPLQMIFDEMVQRMVDETLLLQAARQSDVEESEAFQAALENAREQLLRRVYLTNEVAGQMSEERLTEAYEKIVADEPPTAEVRARHILLESEADALDAIAALEGGADFGELAKERSTGPSATDGGDLGYFTADQMVPAFADAAFALDSGETTDAPVQTEFGWHVIKVEDKRTRPVPAFEEIRSQVEQQLAQELVQAKLEALRADAEIEIVDPTKTGQ